MDELPTDPINRLDDLPVELLYETLYNLNYKDVLNFCQSDAEGEDKRRKICDDPIFWRSKIYNNFPHLDKYLKLGMIDMTNGETALESYKLIAALEGIDSEEYEEAYFPNTLFGYMNDFVNTHSAGKLISQTIGTFSRERDVGDIKRSLELRGLLLYLADKNYDAAKSVLLVILMEDDVDTYNWFNKVKDWNFVNANFSEFQLVLLMMGMKSYKILRSVVKHLGEMPVQNSLDIIMNPGLAEEIVHYIEQGNQGELEDYMFFLDMIEGKEYLTEDRIDEFYHMIILENAENAFENSDEYSKNALAEILERYPNELPDVTINNISDFVIDEAGAFEFVRMFGKDMLQPRIDSLKAEVIEYMESDRLEDAMDYLNMLIQIKEGANWK